MLMEEEEPKVVFLMKLSVSHTDLDELRLGFPNELILNSFDFRVHGIWVFFFFREKKTLT